jgi:hypothetical protein
LRQKDAELSLDFASSARKERYDKKHKQVFFTKDQMIYLKLHKGYLPGNPNKKITEQITGPFRIKRCVGLLAYELELPPQWKILPVISVAHLHPAPAEPDPFNRPNTQYYATS